MTYLLHNNLIYGLTTGQTSPTTKKGYVSKTSPRGSWEKAINPLTQALTSGATFVSRVFAGEFNHFKDVLKQAITHNGFALVDVLQPCVSWNKVNTYQYYRDRVVKLEDMGHLVEQVSGYARAVFGRGQIILRNRESGVLCGGSDPRADGCAMGL